MSTQQDSEQQGLRLNVGRNLEVEGDITGGDKVGGNKLTAGGDITSVTGDKVGGDKYEVAQIIQHYYAVTEPETADEAPAPGEAPYRGRQYYDEQDADVFAGRDHEIAAFVGYLRQNQLLVVTGASAVGKSSLIRAGIVPALRRDEMLADQTFPPSGSQSWPIHIVSPSKNPLLSLAVSMTRYEMSVATAASLEADFLNEPKSLSFAVQRIVDRTAGADRLLLVVDQFEELVTVCEDERLAQRFIENLIIAIRDAPLTVVIGLQAAHYSSFARFPVWWETMLSHTKRLEPMELEVLRQVIEQPAMALDWEVEPIVANLILYDVEGSAAGLPLLSDALHQTWLARRGRRLVLPGYVEGGRVQDRLVAEADAFYKSNLDSRQRALTDRLLLRLVELGEGSPDRPRTILLRELVAVGSEMGELLDLLNQLAAARLVVIDDQSLDAEFDYEIGIAHQSLISDWPVLVQLLDGNRDGLRLQRLLAAQTRLWEQDGRAEEDLYQGARLLDMEEWAAKWQEDASLKLNEVEIEFLRRSREAELERLRIEKLQQERELKRAQERAAAEAQKAAYDRLRAEQSLRMAARLRQFVVVLGAVLVITLLAIVFGIYQAGRITYTINRQLNNEVRSAFNQGDYHFATLLALEEENVEIGWVARLLYQGALQDFFATRQQVQAVDNQPLLQRIPYLYEYTVADVLDEHPRVITALAWSPDGNMLASTTEDVGDGVFIWDITQEPAMVVARLSDHNDWVDAVQWSPDGSRLATGAENNRVIIWQTENWSAEMILENVHNGAIQAVAWSPDGKYLAISGNDQLVSLWNTSSWTLLHRLDGHFDSVLALSWSSDSQMFASVSEDGRMIVWDPDAGELVNDLQTNTSLASVAWAPNDGELAIGDWDGHVYLWDPVDELRQDLHQHVGPVWELHWDEEGERLASAGADSNAVIWERTTGATRVLQGHSGEVESVQWRPTGRELASAGVDGTIYIWKTDQIQRSQTLVGHDAGVEAMAWLPNTGQLATGDKSGQLIVWDRRSGNVEWSILAHNAAINAIAAHPADGRLTTGGSDHLLLTWTHDGIAERQVDLGSDVLTIAWDPTGHVLAAGAADGTVVTMLREGEQAEVIGSHDDRVLAVAWQNDGPLLASSGADGVRLWNWDAGVAVEHMSNPPSQVSAVAWSPRHIEWLAAGSEYGEVSISNVSSQELINTFRFDTRVNDLNWSADGLSLVAALADGRTIVWQLVGSGDAGEYEWRENQLRGHVGNVNTAAWSPSGGTLASAGNDQDVRLLSAQFAGHPCQWLQRNLTIEEWTRYRGGPYQATCNGLPSAESDNQWIVTMIIFVLIIVFYVAILVFAWRATRWIWRTLIIKIPVIGPLLDRSARLVWAITHWIPHTLWRGVRWLVRFIGRLPFVGRLQRRLRARWERLINPPLEPFNSEQ